MTKELNMAQLVYNGDPVLMATHSQDLLAHLQVAAFEQFKRGQGFFITFVGATGMSRESTPGNSIWCHPGISLQFIYDDDDGEQVTIDRSQVDNLLGFMDLPHGVLFSGSSNVAEVVDSVPFVVPPNS
jgi:hypothetical protein